MGKSEYEKEHCYDREISKTFNIPVANKKHGLIFSHFISSAFGAPGTIFKKTNIEKMITIRYKQIQTTIKTIVTS